MGKDIEYFRTRFNTAVLDRLHQYDAVIDALLKEFGDLNDGASAARVGAREWLRLEILDLLQKAYGDGEDSEVNEVLKKSIYEMQERIGNFMRGVRKLLGLETWPKMQGDFNEGVLKLLEERLNGR